MVSCKSSWKMMTLDTQHVHILYILDFARIDLTYLEQIPKAIFVPRFSRKNWHGAMGICSPGMSFDFINNIIIVLNPHFCETTAAHYQTCRMRKHQVLTIRTHCME